MAEVLPFLPFPSEPEEIAPPRPPDAEARQYALDIHRSFIVEAPAGSGKTGLLIQRFLKLLADPSVTEPEQLLAITFTIKATAEMRDRVLAHLEAADRDSAVLLATASSDFDRETRLLALSVLERDRQQGWALLENPGRLNIRTIDSVCAEIARTLPVLSGSGGRLTPARDAEALRHQAARRTLLLLGGDEPVVDSALRDLLLHRDGNLADCEYLIADMLSLRDQWGDLIWGHLLSIDERPNLDDAYLDSTVRPRLQQALDHAVCETLGQLKQAFPADVLADLANLASEFASLDGYAGAPSPIAICSGLAESPEAKAAHLDHWVALIHLLVAPTAKTWRRGFNINHIGVALERHHKSQIKALIDEVSHRDDLLDFLCRVSALPPAQYPDEQWRVAKSLFRVLNRALVELQFVFAERSQCDFTELSLLARQALLHDSGADDLASALGARLQHLLVDEMQDTSTGQYDLLELLTASWDGHSQTVFLVGDPRQSIYLFRQARVERFIHALRSERLGDLPLTRLRLTANFRSQQDLVEVFNNDFVRIFPRSSTSEPLPYTNADAILPASTYAAGVEWHAEPLPYAGPADIPTSAQLQQNQRRKHAREILRVAHHWLAKPLPEGRKTIRDDSGGLIPQPWRMAVLVSSRSHLIEIVATLRQQATAASIPFRAIEVEALNERQEVLDLTALTRAILHPADRVAALAVLRAPWCGLSLADLHTLTGADDPPLKELSLQRLIGERGDLLPEESRQRLGRATRILSEASTKRVHLTTAQVVERAWRSLGGDTWLSPPQLSNARRFFQLLDELEAELGGPGRIDFAQIAGRLERLYAEPDPIPPGTAFLELLTIHKAKGLEWDVVFIPSLERGPGRNPPRLLTWSVIESPDSPDTAEDRAAHIMLAPIAAKGESVDALTRWLKRLHNDREAAERKRLFYVACTRAREELHLFASPQYTSRGDLNPRFGSLLKAAWPAVAHHFAADLGLQLAASESSLMTSTGKLTAFVDNHSQDDHKALGRPAAAPLRPVLQRLPLDFDPTARFAEARIHKLPYGEPDSAIDSTDAHFSRPEGSFAARSFGNAVHACLEVLAKRIATGQPPASLLAELPTWTSRIAAILRADGLPPATVQRLAREARAALENVLRDPDGLWLLAAHPGAASEFALTAWSDSDGIEGHTTVRPASVRVDRIFHAGPEPRAPGENFLWIVDYKTTTHGTSGLDDFLAAQRVTYGPQMETYARILAPARSKSPDQVRLALYFPTLRRLTWWKSAASPTITGN